MRSVKAYELREHFKDVCEMVTGGETIIVSRPHSQNIVVISEREYNDMLKNSRNESYLRMLDESRRQIAEGKIVTKTIDELEEMTG